MSCSEIGKEPDRPYRGEFLVRTTPELHRSVALKAQAKGQSLNAWVETALERLVAERPRKSRGRKGAGKL